jgi:hypothetical protein
MRPSLPALIAAIVATSLAAAQELAPPVQVGTGDFRLRRLSGASAADGSFVVAWRGSGSYFTAPVSLRRFSPAGDAVGAELQIGTLTRPGGAPVVAGDDAGGFVVVWSAQGTGSGGIDIVGRRFGPGAVPLGSEFTVNAITSGNQLDPVVALTPVGRSLAVWTSTVASGGTGISGRAFDAAGNPSGAEFQVAPAAAGMQLAPAVAANGLGTALVVWHSRGQDGSAEGVYGRRFAITGSPLGGEFRVNTFTTGIQAFPAVGALDDGGFVVAWESTDGRDGAGPGLFAQRYDALGAPFQAELRVVAGPILLAPGLLTVVPDAGGGFAIGAPGPRAGSPVSPANIDGPQVRRYDAASVPIGPLLIGADFDPLGAMTLVGDGRGRLGILWTERSGFSSSVMSRRYGAAWPTALHVDERPGTDADGNGVIDPGEVAVIGPAWQNAGLVPLTLGGTLTSFTGPGPAGNPVYTIVDGQASYGTVAPGTAAACDPDSGCYGLQVTLAGSRPQKHIDATFAESLAVAGGDDATREWKLHLGGSFDDVPRASPFYRFAETLFHFAVSGGCTATSFCPDAPTTRAQMAVFLLAARLGIGYQAPRPAVGVFVDVPASDPLAPWVEDLWNREIVEGCAPQRYCPADPVTRAQMAVMVLRTAEGTSYVPPPCTTPVFSDVPCSDPFARWINELAARGITAGCGGGLYCPGGPVTRGQMAVFITRTFGLDLYAPATMKDPNTP